MCRTRRCFQRKMTKHFKLKTLQTTPRTLRAVNKAAVSCSSSSNLMGVYFPRFRSTVCPGRRSLYHLTQYFSIALKRRDPQAGSCAHCGGPTADRLHPARASPICYRTADGHTARFISCPAAWWNIVLRCHPSDGRDTVRPTSFWSVWATDRPSVLLPLWSTRVGRRAVLPISNV